MIDHGVLESITGDYEVSRGEAKYGLVAATLIVIKGIVSLALFGYHSVFLNSGYVLGPLVGVVYMAGISYGSIRTSILATEVEESKQIKGYFVETIFELGEVTFPKNSKLKYLFAPALFVLTFLSLTMIGVAVFLAMQLNLVQFFGFTELMAKLTIYMVAFVIILLIAEPEKLKLIAFIALAPVVFLSIACPTIAAYQLSHNHSISHDLKAFDSKNLSLSIGYSISALEIIGYILNIRRMFKDKRDFTKACTVGFMVTSLLYLIPGLLIYLRFGGNLVYIPLYYKAYSDFSIIALFDCLLTVTLLHALLGTVCFSMELFERTTISRLLLRDASSNLSHSKIVACRLLLLTLVALATYLMTDIQLVYSMSGIVVNSILGLILPGLLGILRPVDIRDPNESRVVKYMDYGLVGLGVIAQIVYLVERI